MHGFVLIFFFLVCLVIGFARVCLICSKSLSSVVDVLYVCFKGVLDIYCVLQKFAVVVGCCFGLPLLFLPKLWRCFFELHQW